MPLCAKCSKPFQCTCSAPAQKLLAAVTKDCPEPPKPGAIWVHVTDDRGSDVAAVIASHDGTAKSTTTADGLAVFDPVAAGPHTVDLDPLSVDVLKLYENPTGSSVRPVPVSEGEISYVAYTVARKPALKVKVVEKGGAKLFGAATVTLTGKQGEVKPTGDTTGVADIGRVLAGDYKLVAKLKEDDEKTHATSIDFATADMPFTLTAGMEKEVVVEAEPLNLVKPLIQMEYKVVLLDRKLSDHQGPSEVKLLPDATYIEVSATQTNQAHPYAKTGTLEFTAVSGGAVEAFLDAECTKPLNTPLDAKALLGTTPTKVWLRGTAKGKFKVKLKLEDPADRFVKLDADAGEQEMGVVELQMKVHWHVKSDIESLPDVDPDVEPPSSYNTQLATLLPLPEQKALTDVQKVAEGRVLHAQSPTGEHHDRAKLVITGLVADQWPAGCDAYKITLNKSAKTGDVAVFDARTAGAEQNAYSVAVATLKTGDVSLWVEGKTACKALREVSLDLGLDRGVEGLAKTAKRNADWARFTTVKIEEVKLEYVQEANADKAWDETQKRYYININEKADPDGRKIKISARLSEKILGIPIHFMLAPDRNNLKVANWLFDFPPAGRHFNVSATGVVTTVQQIKWKDVPAALKHKDRPDRKKLLHLGAATDKEGFVQQELQLSRFGGDKFHPAAYLEQDPHLAAFVDGDPTLGNRLPVFAKVRPVQVWRKMYYESIEPPGNGLPASDGIQVTQRRVFLEPELTTTRKLRPEDYKINPSRPAWQFRANAGVDLRCCIGDHNLDDVIKRIIPVTKATHPKLHAFVCDEQFDAAGVVTATKSVAFVNATAQDVTMQVNGSSTGFAIFDPPLQGGALATTATWTMHSVDTAFFSRAVTTNLRHSGTLPAVNLALVSTRASVNMIRVTPPTMCGGAAGGCPCGGSPTSFGIDATHLVAVDIAVQAATGPWGGWAPNDPTPTVVLKRQGTTEADNIVQDTFGHELGHKFGQTRHARLAGLPDHPLYYQRRGGSGTHCSSGTGFTPNNSAPALNPSAPNQLDARGRGAGTYTNGQCVLWHSASSWKREWCAHCALDFSHSDLSNFT